MKSVSLFYRNHSCDMAPKNDAAPDFAFVSLLRVVVDLRVGVV